MNLDVKWSQKWVVDFGQLIDQKVNSRSTSIMRHELGFSHVMQPEHDSQKTKTTA